MTLRRVFAVLLLLQLFNIGLRPTLDPDMWWHLRTGEIVWHHGIPRHDVFSFTVPDHRWVTHEWLSEVLMWSLYSLGGLRMLSLFFAAIAALAFALVYRISEGRPYLAGALVILGCLTAAPSLGARPQTLTLLMAAVFICVLDEYRCKRLGFLMLWVLPVLTAVWVNLHSGYMLGVALVITYAAAAGLERFSPGGAADAAADVRRLGLVALACLAAALLNPNGWRLWLYPFGTLGSTFMQANIAEWGSPDFHMREFWPFAAMLVLGFGGWMWSRERPAWSDILLFVGTGAAGLLSRRHIALFAVVSVPVVARTLAASLRETKVYPLLSGAGSAATPSRRALQMNAAMLAVGTVASVTWTTAKLAKNRTAIDKAFPVAAVDYLQREGLATERGYNTYVWGGYLIWRGIRVFVDGRADVYGDEFLSQYLETLRLRSDWARPLDDFGVEYVLVEHNNPLGTLLAASRRWHQAYGDDVAEVFVRSSPGDTIAEQPRASAAQ